MKVYKMIVESTRPDPKTGEKERKSYTSARAGAAPAGYKCIAVVGYFEKQNTKERASK